MLSGGQGIQILRCHHKGVVQGAVHIVVGGIQGAAVDAQGGELADLPVQVEAETLRAVADPGAAGHADRVDHGLDRGGLLHRKAAIGVAVGEIEVDAVLAGGEIAQIGGAQNDGAVFKAVVGGVDQGIADAQSGELIDVVAKAEADALGAAAGPGAAGHGGSIDDGRGRGHGEGGIGVIAVGEVQVNAVVTLVKVVQIPVGQGHKALVHGVAARVDGDAVHRQVITEVRGAAVRIEADAVSGVLGVGAAGDADAARHGDIDGNGLGDILRLGLDVDHGLIRHGRFGRGLDGQGAGLGAEHDVAGLDGLAVVGHEAAGDVQRILAGGQGIGGAVDAHLGIHQAVAGHGV